MNWKELPSSLQGGIIALLTWFIFLTFAFISGIYTTCWHWSIPQGKEPFICNILFFNPKPNMLTNISIPFMIGVAIGWIVGKVKSKNNSISQDNIGTN